MRGISKGGGVPPITLLMYLRAKQDGGVAAKGSLVLLKMCCWVALNSEGFYFYQDSSQFSLLCRMPGEQPSGELLGLGLNSDFAADQLCDLWRVS